MSHLTTETLQETNQQFEYMLLSRLQGDCEYFLGYGNGSERFLLANSVQAHISEMKKLWEKLLIKPEWLSFEQIENYEKRMLK